MRNAFSFGSFGLCVVALTATAPGCGGADLPNEEAATVSTEFAIPGWLKVVGADVSGAIGGAEVGGWFGPVGAGVGAVIGGAAGSVAAARVHGPGTGPAKLVGIDPSNALNPLDSIGQNHNGALAWTVPSLGPSGCTNDALAFGKWVSPIVESYAAKTMGASADLLASPQMSDAIATAVTLQATGDVDFNKALTLLVTKGAITAAGQKLMLAWYNEVGTLTLPAVLTATKRYEAQVLATRLSDAERTALLAGLSTARYSAYYWAMQGNDPRGTWTFCNDFPMMAK